MAAKKRKDAPAQSNTLLSFFITPNKKVKLPASAPAKQKVKSKTPAQREIIVVDSDTDKEVVPTPSSTTGAQPKSRKTSGSATVGTNRATTKQEEHVGDLFGKPHLLCTPSKEAEELKAAPDEHPVREPSVLEISDDEIEWVDGDDEQVVDEDGDIEVLDTPSRCPICDTALGELDEPATQTHVNACIDTGSVQNPMNAVPGPSCLPAKAKSQMSKAMKPLLELKTPHSNSSAFAVLMTSHKETAAWKEAAEAEENGGKRPGVGTKRRNAPFYKVLQGMPIAVDAFKYGAIPGVKAYFLTHAHSDHYTNLSSSWKHGPIYCSQGTANLITHMLSVDPKWVHPLPMDIPYTIPDTGGVRVTLIEANHCPGSSLFFYEGKQTVNAGDSAFKSPFVGSAREFRYLHCGDFRASPVHVEHPTVKGKRIDHVYLDTTYLDPKYVFPPQPLVISACADLARHIVAGTTHEDPKGENLMDGWVLNVPKPEPKVKAKIENILFIVGTYSIGKERIVKAVATALNSKIYCDARKSAILRSENDPEIEAMLTNKPLDSNVHLLPLQMVNMDKLKIYAEKYKETFTRVVGLRPTGWSYTPPAVSEQIPAIGDVISRNQQRSYSHADFKPARNSSVALQIYGVPYSEHSSFFELTCFALSVDWVKMIATVNVGSENSRGKMTKWFERWEAERKKRNKVAVKNRAPDYW